MGSKHDTEEVSGLLSWYPLPLGLSALFLAAGAASCRGRENGETPVDKIPQYDLADLEWTTKETWVQGESNHGFVGREVYEQLCEEIGGEFVRYGWWKTPKSSVRSVAGRSSWIRTSATRTTRLARDCGLHFSIPRDFAFKIYRQGTFSGLAKMLGMQDIEVGDPAFDEEFIIKSNDEGTVRELLANCMIRLTIQALPPDRIEIKDNDGWFGTKFPDDVDELYFLAPGVIENVATLKTLFELFAALLEQLCRIRVTTRRDPGVSL